MSEFKSSQRFHSLKPEQVAVLHQVLSDIVPIHGRGNFPTLKLRPRDIIIAVRASLQKQGIMVRDVRLNGSTASHVLVQDNRMSYKDLDIIFGVELPSQEEFQVIKESVLGCLLNCLPAEVNRERISSATMKEAYVQKMVKVFNDQDRWSLISLSNNSGKNLELKFVSMLRRQFEFSVDSFQIILDRLLESYLQESQQKHNNIIVKEHEAETKDVSSLPKASAAGADKTKFKKASLLEKGAHNSNTELKDEIHEKENTVQMPKHFTQEGDNIDKTPAEQKEHRENPNEPKVPGHASLNLIAREKQTTETKEAQDKCKDELLTSDSTELVCLNHATLCDKPEELTENIGLEKNPQPTSTESVRLIENSNSKESSEKIKSSRSVCLYNPDVDTTQVDNSVEGEKKVKIDVAIDVEIKGDMKKSEISNEVLTPEEKPDLAQADVSSISVTLLSHNHTLETHSTVQIEKSPDKHDNTTDTQDTPAPPGLVSDKKTSCHPPCKSSERIPHMVVLKHSSPKPPRRMCKKVTTIPYRGPAFKSDSKTGSSLDANSSPEEPDVNVELRPEPSSVTTTGLDPTTNPISTTKNPNCDLSSNLNFSSTPDPTPDSISFLPQEPESSHLITECLFVTDIQSQEDRPRLPEQRQSSPENTALQLKQTESPYSPDSLVSHIDESCSNAEQATHTSEVATDDEKENKESLANSDKPNGSNEKTRSPHLPSSPLSITPLVSCLSLPVLSFSPPHFTPSPPSLSSPPCVTPPSHCLSSAMLHTASPVTSYGSPPLSLSPTSSCISSPPYLTPPLLSLSPPPACPTPPSPCLSPPLLCFTPPVESKDSVFPISSDTGPLIDKSDSDEQIFEPPTLHGDPLLELEGKTEQPRVSLLTQDPEPVSFPITLPSATAHALPQSKCGEPSEHASPNTDEAFRPLSETDQAQKTTADMTEESSGLQAAGCVPAVEVLAESMYGDFEAAMAHLRYRLIATRNPEEIRGGGLLKYSNLLVRDYRPASETQIKTLERYMCSRFFIDFPDVQEQQRKILSYLKNHFIGEERSKYQYLMTLRRVVDDSTVCLMGHERRQTLNMITVLALKVLGEQNIIPNTDHVTCFYQPAPYLAEHNTPYLTEPSYCSYYIPQGGSTLLYQPYPLHLHTQTGLV